MANPVLFVTYMNKPYQNKLDRSRIRENILCGASTAYYSAPIRRHVYNGETFL